MKKAINLYFIQRDTKEKLYEIKKSGFDGVLLGVYNKNETMTLEEQIEYCKSVGLEISMIHCSYYEPKLNSLWLAGDDGDNVARDLVDQITAVSKYNVKNFVMHTNGSFDVENTKRGIERLKSILKTCEKFDTNLNIENLYSDEQVNYIFKNVKHKNLTFCFDCGHENFLTPDKRLARIYKDRMTTVHLHDNYGSKDEHSILGYGTVNIKELAEDLSGANIEFLTLELKADNDVDMRDYLKKAKASVDKLDKMITEINS